MERLLADLELGVGGFASCDIRRGHQLTFDSRPAAGVHYCMAGMGALRIRNGGTVELRRHSFALLPPNVVYTLGANNCEESGSTPRRRLRAPLFKESVPVIQAGKGETGIVTACGEVRFEGLGAPGLFTHLREPLVEHFEGASGLEGQFISLLSELARPRFGTRALTEALLKQCLILLLRRKIERGSSALSWMAGLADPGLSRAMQAILERFSEPLALTSLAAAAGMSRSAFASRFAESFGRTPMSVLRSVRLSRSKELLATSNFSVERIAAMVGFSSRSNFSRAFREAYGSDPTKFRASSLV
jgi:AraC family transcriptional activator of mtrCDE